MRYVTHDPNQAGCTEPDKELTITLNEGEVVLCGECGTALAVIDTEPGDVPDA
jgi:hypothetical protein